MGLCCCKIKDDDAPPVNQRQSTANLIPPNTNHYSRNYGTIQPVRENAQHAQPKIIKPRVRTAQLAQRREQTGTNIVYPKAVSSEEIIRILRDAQLRAQLAQRNDRIATNIVYPRAVSPEHHFKRLIIDPQRHKRISHKCKVNLNVKMLKMLFTALDIDVTQLPIPIRHPYEVDRLQPDSSVYLFAMNQLNNKKFLQEYRITEILKVWNPYTLAQFKLRKCSMENMCERRVEETILFHGTKVKHLRNILTNNFDWRKVKNGLCGWGISFANNPWYASHYSIKDCGNGGTYLMILAKVLIGQTSYGDSSTIVPSEGDTTTRIKDRQVFVKYDDCSFYPEFVVHFTKKY